MLKKLTILLAVVLLTASISKAQWVNQGAWPDTSWKNQNHAIAVDGEGKVWIGRYANIANYAPTPGKPLRAAVYLTYIFNQDGTQAAFSPIFQVMGDTMYNTTQRGMRTNIDGNILLTTGGPAMYLIDHKTGLGLKKATLPGAPTAPCVTKDGVIFVGPVSPGAFPVQMYDQNLELIGGAISVTKGFSRSFEVSKDGNTIYWAGYTTGKITIYTRADEFSAFEEKDSMMVGVASESMTWHPKTGQLWVSAGSNNDKPKAPYTMGTWYAYDFTLKKVVDSLKWKYKDITKPDERPRALAFSNDGNVAYIGQFGTSNGWVQKVVKSGTSVKFTHEIPTGYVLSQNYPNPFNPTTNINFSLPESGFVTLKVYNTLGQEVATLINEFKNAGSYQVDFNAKDLSTGMYLYTLTTGMVTISKKMLLVK